MRYKTKRQARYLQPACRFIFNTIAAFKSKEPAFGAAMQITFAPALLIQQPNFNGAFNLLKQFQRLFA